MKDYLEDLFDRQPQEIVDGDYYFHTDNEGDQFDETDVKLWLEGGIFKESWEQAIQNEWADFDAIKKVFDLWGKPIWNSMKAEKPWKEKFAECGFTIESCEKVFCRRLHKDDNDLGEQADAFGIDITLKFNLYILRKFAK